MTSTVIQIDAARLMSQVADVDAPSLDPADCRHMPIVEIIGHRVDIIDGYHRIAGMIRAGATVISCVTCDDADVLSDAANPEDSTTQAAAIAAIYAAI